MHTNYSVYHHSRFRRTLLGVTAVTGGGRRGHCLLVSHFGVVLFEYDGERGGTAKVCVCWGVLVILHSM